MYSLVTNSNMLCLAARIRLKAGNGGPERRPVSAVHTQLLLGDNERMPQVRKIIPAMASDRGSSGVKLWSRSEQMKGDE